MADQDEFLFHQEQPNYPGEEDRLSIVGATGSGKTHAAAWHLSRSGFDRKPWIIYDYKLDSFLATIPGIVPLDVAEPPPERPGLYIVRPRPRHDDKRVEEQMEAVWEREDTGIYIDEGYMIAGSNIGFENCLVQGRSKQIPMIVLTQRPVWVNKFVFTESEFKQVFRLQDTDDMIKMERYIPRDLRRQRLPKWHSYYYDSIEDDLRTMKPLPDQNAIRATFAARMAKIPRVL